MKNPTIKPYIVNDKLRLFMPNTKIAYTIQHYDNGMWRDGNITMMLYCGLSYYEYVDLMKLKFDCIHFDSTLFFKSKKQCEEAIEFLDTLLILKKLI